MSADGATAGRDAGWFGSREVCGLAGVTYRKLDYWARIGLLHPSVAAAEGHGSVRRYSLDDAVAVRLVAQLTEAGMMLRSAVAAVDAFWRSDRGLSPEVVVVVDGTAEVCAVADVGRCVAGMETSVMQLVRLDTIRAGVAGRLADLAVPA